MNLTQAFHNFIDATALNVFRYQIHFNGSDYKVILWAQHRLHEAKTFRGDCLAEAMTKASEHIKLMSADMASRDVRAAAELGTENSEPKNRPS